MVRFSKRAMSPPSMLQSDMSCGHDAPAAQASTSPAGSSSITTSNPEALMLMSNLSKNQEDSAGTIV